MVSLAALGLILTLSSENSVEVKQRVEPLEILKKSPLKFPPNNEPYVFEWLTEGFGIPVRTESVPKLRFRIYSQDRKVHGELSEEVGNFLMALWKHTYTDYRIDHKPDYNKSCVDVYLCFAGDPGGEQLFDDDPQAPKGASSKVNTIYIYDLPSLKEPLEKIRELAHEYGHAVLPAVGGYEAPEYWANGYLGEKLFLQWLAKTKSEFFGVSPTQLENYAMKACGALTREGATNLPYGGYFVGTGKIHMDRYIGLMLWLNAILPPAVFGHAMKLMPSFNAKDAPKTVLEAIDTQASVKLTSPPEMVGKQVWVPFGTKKLIGATPIQKNGGWALITLPASGLELRS